MHFFRVSPSIIVPGRLKVQYWSDQAPNPHEVKPKVEAWPHSLLWLLGICLITVWSGAGGNAMKCQEMLSLLRFGWKDSKLVMSPLHFWWCVWHFPLEALWCTKRCSEPAYFNNAWNLILQRCWRQNLDAARVYESQAKLDQTHTDISVLQLMIAAAASIHFSNLYFDFNCHCFVSWKNPRSHLWSFGHMNF